ncbi:hypothetical protein E2C01_094497 [Portunus trituberculatus]|uniref:Uncharacterized protein n=1 Tax=Portunus trituberculatus TaxID=210409 RepID=A0A5B7JMA3_PORTR|nr:hypothetical protein [Portunus trituberculatus]
MSPRPPTTLTSAPHLFPSPICA